MAKPKPPGPAHDLLPPADYWDIDVLTHQDGVLTLELDMAGGPPVRVMFEDAYAYFVRDEGDALKTLNELKARGNFGKTLYEVVDSHFMDWFREESLGIRDHVGLKHFRVVTHNLMADIISREDPQIIGPA